MPEPKAETNRRKRGDDGVIFASLIDDVSNHPVKDKHRKKQLICYSLVLIEVLMWETFVEDLVDEAQDFLLDNLSDPTKLDYQVLLPVSDALNERKDKRQIWTIAGDGWKKKIREHRKQLLDGFHTPRPSKVDSLIVQTTGLANVSKLWRWKNSSNTSVLRRLNELVSMRGEIAHNLLSVKTLNSAGFANMLSTMRIGYITSNALREHIHEATGKHPWDKL